MKGEIEDREGKEGGRQDRRPKPSASARSAFGLCTWSLTAEPRPHAQDAGSPDVKSRRVARPTAKILLSNRPTHINHSSAQSVITTLQIYGHTQEKKGAQNTNTEQ